MKSVVIAYSLTGNNQAFAHSVAKSLAAEEIQITEPKKRGMGMIILDMLFNRTPKVMPLSDNLGEYEFVLFFGPVWMGKLASPLRPYLRDLKKIGRRYGFISISGGADGANPKLKEELEQRTGSAPVLLLDLHIAALPSSNPKPTRKETSAYRLNPRDIEELTTIALQKLKESNFA